MSENGDHPPKSHDSDFITTTPYEGNASPMGEWERYGITGICNDERVEIVITFSSFRDYTMALSWFQQKPMCSNGTATGLTSPVDHPFKSSP